MWSGARFTLCLPHYQNVWSSQSVKVGIDLSIDKSIKIGKSDLITIVCIEQSVEIDDTLVSFIDVSRFYRFHRFKSVDTSVLLFIQKWKLISWKQWICWQLSCNWESKDQTIYYHFFKEKFKKSYLFFKTRFKVFFWWPILARFVGAQFFHDLALPMDKNRCGSSDFIDW